MDPQSPNRFTGTQQPMPSGHQQRASPLVFEQSAALTFHNVEYLIYAYVRYIPANATGDQQQPQSPNTTTGSIAPSSPQQGGNSGAATLPLLVIEAEQRSNGARWIGEFNAVYIEQMSLKTGNFKKFTLFLKMLSSALSKSSDHVFIDLLTFEDLEVLKVRKAGGGAVQPQPHQLTAQKLAVAQQNKRYLILTYVVEFDKVHYPLPLKFEMDPSPASLKQSIARLRSELDLARQQNMQMNPAMQSQTIEKYKSELYRLAEENHRLKSLLANRPAANKVGAGENEEKTASSTATTTSDPTSIISPLELESLHSELRSLRSQLDSKHLEHNDLLRQISGLMSGMPVETIGLQTSLDNMSKQIWNLQNELRVEQQLHSKVKIKAEKEQEVLMTELERRLEAERLLRAKCRRLQDELDDAMAALESKRGGGGLRGSSSRDSLSGGGGSNSRGSIRGPASRRPLSATSPSPVRGGTMGRAGMGSTTSPGGRAGSRNNSRPTSAASSRSNSPAPSYSREREGRARAASASRERSNSSTGGARSRSPSPSLSNGARFDPSAYVKAKAAERAEKQRRTEAMQRDARAGVGGKSRSPDSHRSIGSPSSSARGPSRSASHTNLDRSAARGNSSSNKDSSMPPRVPRPSSAARQQQAASDSPKKSSRRAQDSDSEFSDAKATTTNSSKRKDDSFDESEDERRSDHNRNSKDNESIDQRFSALQNFLKQQKVDS